MTDKEKIESSKIFKNTLSDIGSFIDKIDKNANRKLYLTGSKITIEQFDEVFKTHNKPKV